jgi:hypothetical protein
MQWFLKILVTFDKDDIENEQIYAAKSAILQFLRSSIAL